MGIWENNSKECFLVTDAEDEWFFNLIHKSKTNHLYSFFIFIEKYNNDVVIEKDALNSLLSCKFPKGYKDIVRGMFWWGKKNNS